MSPVVISMFSGGTVLIGGVLLWRYRREPEKWIQFLSIFALWLAALIIIMVLPVQWVPHSTPGHPTW
jgi:hypothetical protein